MNPIIILSQLDLKTYYNINLYILLRRIWWLGVLLLGFIFYMYFSTDPIDRKDPTFIFIISFLILDIFAVPLINYWGVRRNFKKIKSMSELKTYELDENDLKFTGQTSSAIMDWSVIDKIIERHDYYLAFVSNGKAIHYFPKAAFSEDGLKAFRQLIKIKGIKNKFKY